MLAVLGCEQLRHNTGTTAIYAAARSTLMLQKLNEVWAKVVCPARRALPLVIDPATRDPHGLTFRPCDAHASRIAKSPPGDFTSNLKSRMDTRSETMIKLALDTVDLVTFAGGHWLAALFFRRTVFLRSWKIHNRSA